jgi:hypothetical protein
VFTPTSASHHRCRNQAYELQHSKHLVIVLLILFRILSSEVVHGKLVLFVFTNLWCSVVLICNMES